MKVSEITRLAKKIARNGFEKKASTPTVVAPPATELGTALRKIAGEIRSFNSNELLFDSLNSVVSGELTKVSQTVEKISIEKKETDADSLRELASALRKAGQQQKTASDYQALSLFKSTVAQKQLEKLLG